MSEIAVRVGELVLERKGEEVVSLDLRGISDVADHFLIATGNSDVQVRAIADHVVKELKLENVRPNHMEGLEAGRWILIDYTDVVVHIFHPVERDFYQLDSLWGDAPKVVFDTHIEKSH